MPPVALAQPVSGWWGSMGEPPPARSSAPSTSSSTRPAPSPTPHIYLSVNRVYDSVLLESVKQWRYQPATKDGRPVNYRRVTGVVSGR